MLRRERQIRAWVQRLLDASLFGIGLWLAHWIRKVSGIEVFGGKREIPEFHEFIPLLLILPFTPLILAGSPEDLERFVPTAVGGAFDGLEVVAQVDLNKHSIEDLVEMLHFHSANAVVISAKHTYFGQVEKAVQACELEGVEAWLLADFFNTQVSQTSLDEFSGRPVLIFRSAPADSWQRVAKQALDFVGAAVFLLATSPFFVGFALAV